MKELRMENGDVREADAQHRCLICDESYEKRMDALNHLFKRHTKTERAGALLSREEADAE